MIDRKVILAIESSCDETSVSVVENETIILSNIVASQVKSHKRFGGVVPEVASRHHVEQILSCLEEALEEANVSAKELTAVAVTYGPGLVGALLIGISAAKAFAWANQVPLIPINHMAGHISAAKFVDPDIRYPAMALLVSGGHTELVYMKEEGSYAIVGETRDDAAGEAYDKVGRVMGLSYPSGKEIDEMAHLGQDTYQFPRAMLHENNYDFSFSGLKSAFINTVHNAEQRNESLDKNNLATSFQASVVEVLTDKTLRACEEYKVQSLIVAGGVAANKGLRESLLETVDTSKLQLIIPPISLCGDNAAMIAAAAFIEMKKKVTATWDLNAKPGLSFERITES
ncbi:tRNA (adenosine(37)-N6)-threonylcarbamoyltransferase complex transferase subunit TsaD [Vagococcus entomophilus]|uniref:tRNA N6-adenosine threonylcarbamoyltransferase n=1 Tax=Vagococcus entomophilus TaxID=1160095 RepID=A0A430AKI0_9ENTE|nr:tRNA (adenosine(37)-N6)-threonylcarbamoyltransferase complex transferase subunit TsaD [Vagococcus entomophilus]